MSTPERDLIVGGQAVIEGVMMRTPNAYAIAVRKADGTIVNSEQPDVNQIFSKLFKREVKLSALPDVRTVTAEEYWPDIEGLDHRDTVTDFGLPEGTFFDCALVHLLTTATLDRLRDLYPQGRFEVRRFRPNIVMETANGERDFVFVGGHRYQKSIVSGELLVSNHRQEEIKLIRWDDLDVDGKRVLVGDMKHPGEKIGNDASCDLPDQALAIILAMPRTAREFFPYSADAISAAFTRACQFLEIEDLRSFRRFCLIAKIAALMRAIPTLERLSVPA